MGTVEIATRLGKVENTVMSPNGFMLKDNEDDCFDYHATKWSRMEKRTLQGESTEDEEDGEGDMTRHNPKEDATTTSRWSVDGGVGNSLSLSLSLVGLGYT